MSIAASHTPASERTDGIAMKVLLADDHPLILAGIRRTLERSDGIEIVGEARSSRELLSLIPRRRPQVVLMDLRMPDSNGTGCIEAIRGSWPEMKIVVLSACDDRPSIDGALAAGASAYIVKSVDPVDIASVLRQTWRGGNVYYAVPGPQPVIGRVTEPASPVELTQREQTVLAGLAAGKTTAEISHELWLSEHTIKYHLTNIYRKLGVTNRAAAVRQAFEHELVSSELAAGRAA